MNALHAAAPNRSRRRFLLGSGSLVVGFSLLPAARLLAQQADAQPKLPGSLAGTPMLDSWIRVGADGRVTIFTGKVELGQGIRTALLQVAAEELEVPPGRITLITADTSRTPDEGYTAGSHSMQDSATAIRFAAAQVRGLLLARAATVLNAPIERLTVQDGVVIAASGARIGYGNLIDEGFAHVRSEATAKLKDPAAYTLVGKAWPRVDIPAKVTGGVAYVQDLRLPGMVHARVVRPPSYGARLREVDPTLAQKLPGVLRIVRDGSYLAVVAQQEYQAILAMRALAAGASWDAGPPLPKPGEIFDVLQRLPNDAMVDLDEKSAAANAGARSFAATYRRPYQIHGSIGPSCAVGWYKGDRMTVWTHSQGVFPLRKAIAELTHLPEERVVCIHAEGAGCYGHNGADDAAADAALLALAYPEGPVRVQWMREQEHAWEPFGPAMITSAKASVDSAGNLVAWDYEVWSNSHSTRPGGGGNLMPSWHLAAPLRQPPARPLPLPEGGGDRNAIPFYKLPNARVVHRFIQAMPLRVSALRGLGAYMNVFSIESFMDEVAAGAGLDPVEFRLRHIDDPRAREVITTAATRFGWTNALAKGHGRGFAFARYKNLAAYLALTVEVEVMRESGKVKLLRAVAAIDSGQAVNPDGIRNQVEGGIVQSASWTLYEQVEFNEAGITTTDWAGYPIARFPDIADSIEVHVIDRPGQPYLGTGEAAQGPTAAAIANAIAHATGARLRDLPLSRSRVKAAIGV